MHDKPKARRPYGTGTLYQKSGSWYGRWLVGGQRVNRRIGPVRKPGSREGLTRSQAERELRKLMEKDHAVAAAPARLTVEEAGDRMIDHLEALGRKPSTIEGYRSALRVHLAPYFKTKALDRIETDDVERFIAYERRAGREIVERRGKKKTSHRVGSAPKAIANYLGVLHGIFDFANRRGWVVGNPVKLAERPQQDETTEIRFLTMDEVEAVLRVVPEDPLGDVERVMYLAAAVTGMRQGELIALRWRDVDWSARRVRVRRNYVRGKFGTPKSKRSSRAVPLIDRLAGQLDLLAQRTSFGGDDHLVFAHPSTGGPLDRSKVLKRFKAAMRRAQLGHRLGEGGITFHSLRHTFGTRMAAQGVPMRTLQELMGHRDFSTTLRYADYSPSSHEAEWAESAFAGDSSRDISDTNSQQLPTTKTA